MRLLLASKSQTRQRMLEAAGVPLELVAAELDEEEAKQGLIATGFEPRDLAEMLAEMKARAAGPRNDALVLGADQVLEREDGSLLSKPSSPDALSEQLRSLSGRLHYLHSAAVVFEGAERAWGHTETVALRMRRLSDRFIRDYVAREYEAVRWNVGGYRIEGSGVQLFEAVEGSHFAILGLPLLPLLDFLRRRGLLAT
ncbi:MAG TPA: Maf family protein [Allosphingosinicella sp.]|jgi:septum formation protein|nr:Maf family protein [Allosphingosinicella sp.]